MTLPLQLASRYTVEGRHTTGRPGSWRAWDAVRGHDVAIRLLPGPSWPRELALLPGIAHPGLLPVLDVGTTTDDRAYVAQPLEDSRPFDGAQGLGADEVIRGLGPVLDALSLLHGRGWTHGGIDSASVRLHRRGGSESLLLHTFGWIVEAGGGALAPAVRGARLAPELLRGAPPTVASDLFAVGALATAALGWELDQVPSPRAAGALQGWLAHLTCADPQRRPASARDALTLLEALAGTPLTPSSWFGARLVGVGPGGREELVGRLAEVARQGGLGVVLGDGGSGRTTVLRALLDSLRGEGHAAEYVTLTGDPERSLRALHALLVDHGRLVHGSVALGQDDQDLGAALRAREARLLHACRRLLRGAGPFLFDDLDATTLAGRVLLRALAAREGVAGVVVAADGASQVPLEQAITRRADPRDLPVLLSPLSAEQIARWLHESLGPVQDGPILAELLRREAEGRPGLIGPQIELLLARDALRLEAGGWTWNLREVVPLLGGVTQPYPRRAPEDPGAPQTLLRGAERADRLVEAGDPGAALALLLGVEERAFASSPAHRAPLWARIARCAVAVGRPLDAIGWHRRLYDAAVDPDERVRWLTEEARDLHAGQRPAAALALLSEARPSASSEPGLRVGLLLARLASALEVPDHSAARSALGELRPLLPSASLRGATQTVRLSARLSLSEGRSTEALAELRSALAGLPDDAPLDLGAELEGELAAACVVAGQVTDAIAHFERALGFMQRSGRLPEAAALANAMAAAHQARGAVPEALLAWDQAAALAADADLPVERVNALIDRGALLRDTGQLDRAAELLDDAVRSAARLGLPSQELRAMIELAETWARMGDSAIAADALADALSLAEARRDHTGAAETAARQASHALDHDDLHGAHQHLERAERARSLSPMPATPPECEFLASLLALRGLGRTEGAEARAMAAIRALERGGRTLVTARARIRLASALARQARFPAAESLLDDAEAALRPLDARPDLGRADEVRRQIALGTRHSLQTLSRHHDWLQQLTLALARERDVPRLLDLILDRALDLVGEERGLVRLLDPNGLPRLQVVRPAPTVFDDPTRPAHVSGAHAGLAQLPGASESIIAGVIRERVPAIIVDTQDSDLPVTASIRESGLRSIVCVPILRSGAVLGVLYVDGASAIDGSAPVKAALLSACAEAAAVAIENAQLIEDLRSKQEAMAILSHELRTPITSIIGFASLLLADEPDRTAAADQEMLGFIKAEAERVRAMVGDVLDLARMQAGALEPRRDRVDPLALLVTAVDTLRPLARQAEVALHAEADEDLPDLRGDEGRLMQILHNLIGNALKFAPPGGLVTVQAGRAEGGVAIVVRDDGPGIPLERMRRIFEPWQQAGSSRMRQKGVGLGLAISLAIAHQHGGHLHAQNRPEGGAAFTLWLPLDPGDHGHEALRSGML